MHIARLGTLALLVVIAACSRDAAGPDQDNDPVLANGTFTMRVDGQQFAAISAGVLSSNNIISIGAGNASGQAVAMAWLHDSNRTYTIGTDVGVNANYNNGSAGWLAVQGSGSGWITVTTRTANRVAGTFTFVLEPTAAGATATRTIEGSFDLTY